MQEWTIDDIDLMGAPLYVRIHAIVCLLSVLFLLPYCSRGHAPLLLSLGGWCLATYSFLVLPLLISANYKYPTRWLRNFISSIPGYVQQTIKFILKIMKDIHARIEENFKNVTYKNFHLIISQMIYFTLCDCVPLIHDNESKQKAVRALTTLLLYTIITFFGTKVEKIICKTEDISTHRQSQRHSYNTSIFIIFLKIILEFLKAAMVILCLREQGLNYYYNVNYTILTGLYYILSEDFYLDIICAMIPEKLLRKFGTGNETVDNDLGKLCVYVGSSSLVILMGCVMITMTQFKGVPLISIVFAIIILPAIKMNVLYVNAVREYISFLKMFPIVGHDKLKLLEDVCPICLDEMADGSARGTPCGHTYHFTCLLRSLEVSKSCPLCKHEF